MYKGNCTVKRSTVDGISPVKGCRYTVFAIRKKLMCVDLNRKICDQKGQIMYECLETKRQ